MREKQNLTYKKVADAINISKTYYFQIENGHRRLYFDLAVKISIFFGIKLDKLFYNDFNKKEASHKD